jgi:hypothetical protein
LFSVTTEYPRKPALFGQTMDSVFMIHGQTEALLELREIKIQQLHIAERMSHAPNTVPLTLYT